MQGPTPSPTPFWPNTATDWAPLIGLAFVVAAALVGLIQLGQSIRTRHASLLADISRRWSSAEMEESQHLANYYEADLHEAFPVHLARHDGLVAVLLRTPDFFEDLAVLVRMHAVSFRMLEFSLGALICGQWDAWSETVLFLRDKDKDDQIYDNFERLAMRMKKRVARRAKRIERKKRRRQRWSH